MSDYRKTRKLFTDFDSGDVNQPAVKCLPSLSFAIAKKKLAHTSHRHCNVNDESDTTGCRLQSEE